MHVYLIGTLDTKAREIAWVRHKLRRSGVQCAVIDAGCQGEAGCDAEFSRDAVFEAAGTSLQRLRDANDRGRAVAAAADGVTKILADECASGKVGGVLALGGSAGTTIGTTAMRGLPLDVPKIMVSTMASGQTRPYVGGRNIMMMNSVVDIAGINRISRTVLGQAVAAMAGMVQKSVMDEKTSDRPLIAATMFGVTTPCVLHAQAILEEAGYEVLVFHATGNGGEAMEGLIRDGMFAGVLDITTTEIADELIGGVLSAGPNRLTAAADMGIPQVVSVGAVDMVNFGTRATVPEKFSDRLFYEHNATVTLMRTTMNECQQIGEEIGRKASRSAGPVSVLFPSLGVSAIDVGGKPFDNWAARMAVWEGLRTTCAEKVELKLLQNTINDKAFATAAAERLLELLSQSNGNLK